MNKLYDKYGRELMINDVVRVRHFTDSRRKKHYMYKQVAAISHHSDRIYFVHLAEPLDRLGYSLALNNTILPDYEIVQGYDKSGISFENRKSILKEENNEI